MRTAILIVFLIATPLTYGESYEEYWNKWHQDSENVSTCDSITSVVEFLEHALKNLGNAERTQANSETIEALVIEYPDCFCNAFVKLPGSSRAKIKRFFLETPLFHEKETLDAALFSNKISKQCHAS